MQSIIDYNIAAVVILIVTILIYTFKKKVSNKSSRLFTALLWATLISTIFDIISWVCQLKGINGLLPMLSNSGYFLIHNATPVIFLAYVAESTDAFAEFSKKTRFLAYSPWIVHMICVFVNPFYELYFYIDESGIYHRGKFLYIAYAVAGYFLLLAVFLILRSARNMSDSMVIPICSFIAVSILAVLIQAMFPKYMVECFGVSLCLMVIMFTLQNQSEVIESETNMLNKTMFVKEISAALDDGEQLTFLFIRIPDFKMIVDTFGSGVGSRLLSTFSQYLYKHVSFGEAYYLDDECFVLVSKDDRETARRLYEKLSQRLEDSWQIVEARIYLSTYMMVIDAPDEAPDYDSLDEYVNVFKSHDFTTKRLLKGKDISVSNSQRRKEVERAIENSLEKGGFSVCYQPIFNVEEGRIVSCEALVRLNDEKLGSVFPDEFIPIAERNGSISDIGRFVFESACALIKDSRAAELGLEYVHINLSVVQCMNPALVEEFTGIMELYDVKPHQICLEITETASAFTPHMMERNIEQLAERGFILALDDFGSGYSNMNNLLRFPFRFIKFDKEIVWNSFEAVKGKIALEGTIAMIKKLGIKIVAEGIEDSDQARALIGYSCEYLQGYLFSKPVRADEFFDCLRDSEGIVNKF